MQRTLTALTCLLLSAAFAQASSTSSGVSRDFNPAISVNGLILYASGLVEATEHDHDALRQDGHEHAHGAAEGLQIQETELQLTASIDPYARANVVFAMHGTSGVDLEEGYLQVLTVPRGLGLRAGTFLWEFGKHNSLHTHQYPFVEKPVAWTGLLGTHGLAGTAVELSWLSPLPWYAELLATTFPLTETVHGDHEIPPNSWGQALRLRQFWDLGERATLGAGLSWLRGDMVHAHNVEQRQEAEEGTRYFFGADLTWKWTGTGANPRQLELQGEWLRRRDVLPDDSAEYDGVYTAVFTSATPWQEGSFYWMIGWP